MLENLTRSAQAKEHGQERGGGGGWGRKDENKYVNVNPRLNSAVSQTHHYGKMPSIKNMEIE